MQGIIENSTQRGGLVQVTAVLDATRAHAARLEEENALLQHHLHLVRSRPPYSDANSCES
jgi:hypothetical protein